MSKYYRNFGLYRVNPKTRFTVRQGYRFVALFGQFKEGELYCEPLSYDKKNQYPVMLSVKRRKGKVVPKWWDWDD